MSKIVLRVDRLVLEGLALPPEQQAALRSAVAETLRAQLGAGGLAEGLAGGGARASIRGGDLGVPAAGEGPEQLGASIGAAVYRGIGR